MDIIKKIFKRRPKGESIKKEILSQSYLKHSNEFIFYKDNIIEKVLIPLIIIDKNGYVKAFNNLAKNHFFLHLNEKITNQIRVPEFSDNLKKIMKKKKLKVSFNFMKPGSIVKYFQVECQSINIYKMPIINYPLNKGYIISIIDNTQTVKLEKFKSEFIGNLSHELKTPLAVILGIAETFMYQKRLPVKDKNKFLTTLINETNKMKDLVNDLLKLAKIEMEEHIKPRKSVSLNKIINNSVNKFSNKAKKRRIKIKLSQNKKNLFIKGNENQLEQLFDNLIDNSIKYGKYKSKLNININLAKKRDMLSVKIIDESKGIPKQFLQRITERFYRLEETKKIEGTGLGLSIAKHIAAKHNAKFNISSIRNKGSTFEIIFPYIST